MKFSMLFAVPAISLLAAVSPAKADCPGAGQTFSGGVDLNPNLQFLPNGFRDNRGDRITGFAPGGDFSDFDDGSKTDDDCFTAAAVDTATGQSVSGVIIQNPGDPDEGIYVPPESRAYGPNGVAIGNNAQVLREETYTDDNGTPGDPDDDFQATRRIPVENGTAVGANSLVSHDNSTALGSGATSTDDHQLTLGTKDDTIRAEGIPTQKARNRQQGPVEVVTSDQGGRLATDGGEIFSRLDDLDGSVSNNRTLIDRNSDAIARNGIKIDDLSKGVAIAAAMPDAWLGDTKRFGIFGSVGGFDDETALGFAAIGRIDETWSLNAKLGVDTSFDKVGWQVGAGAQW